MSSLSSLHAFPDSSYADVAPTLSPSSVAVAARVSRSALVTLQAVSSLVPVLVGGTRLTSRISLVGPDPCTFGLIDKHIGAWAREAQLIFFILARSSFSLPPLKRMKALCLALVMSGAFILYNKQTQGDDSWNVDMPEKNGEHVSICGPH